MKYAIIGKWNNRVQRLDLVSNNLDGSESVYEIETEYSFNEPLIPDTYEYDNGTFKNVYDFPLEIIDENWVSTYSDYKSARVSLYIATMMKGGFNSLDLIEKKIASKWFVVGRSERNQVHTVEEQITNGLIFHESSIDARRKRFSKCITETYNRLDDDQIKQVMINMKYSETVYAYINLGIEGTLEGNPEGLFDYIDARVGTQFEVTGLRAQSYTPVGYANCGQLADRLMDILINGNY